MGLGVQQIIDEADRRTERRAGKELDLLFEFWMALNEFCLEKRFPWRKKTFTVNTSVGVQTYDLSAAGLNVAPDFYEMITLYNVQPGGALGGSIQFSELSPMLSEDLMNQALEATSNGAPSGYYINPGTTQGLLLNAPMNSVYKLRGNYWAVPDPSLDSSIEVVPLVPPQLTPGLVTAVEWRLLEYLLGQRDPRVERAEKRYRRFVAIAAKMFKFTTNASLQFADQDTAIRAVDASTSGLDNTLVQRSG